MVFKNKDDENRQRLQANKSYLAMARTRPRESTSVTFRRKNYCLRQTV